MPRIRNPERERQCADDDQAIPGLPKWSKRRHHTTGGPHKDPLEELGEFRPPLRLLVLSDEGLQVLDAGQGIAQRFPLAGDGEPELGCGGCDAIDRGEGFLRLADPPLPREKLDQ